MSSRALRKLQKEQNLDKQFAFAREADEAENEESESESESDAEPTTSKPKNAFDVLEDVEEEDSEDEQEYETLKTEILLPDPTPTQSSKSKKKKKKSKKKGKGKAVESTTNGTSEKFDMDEIDRALKELAINNAEARATLANNASFDEKTKWETNATKLLGIDSKNLNPVNEMKSLFGDIAVEASHFRSPRRPREQPQQGLDLGTALTGRHSPASNGKELGTLAGRRNALLQGKEEWPLATSGGLSMEYQPDSSSVGKKYNIIHSKVYQETQGQFRTCVNSMDPQNLISLLMLSPYHIATLLQVSEFAKVQGDHSVSGDLLERALFTFGRSVHSTFGVALKNGTARIGFEDSQNRELYLSIWRYIRNLEMRGTWKTAFEWAKMLLQFNMLEDPYGITLAIDQLALKGRQHAAFIEMCSEDAYGKTWAHLPNIQISLALAYNKNKEPKLAREQLAFAMQNYPYTLAELAKALEIGTTPKTLWGQIPSTEAEKLYTELYITRAKDLWNNPEYTALLVEVAETLDYYPSPTTNPPKLEIALEDARHIMLLEVPHLIALLPRKFTRMQSSSSDVLPPPSDRDAFIARGPQSRASNNGVGVGMGLLQTIFGTISASATDMMERVLSLFSDQQLEPGMAIQQDALMQAGAELGMEPQEMQNVLVHLLLQAEERARDTPGGWPDAMDNSNVQEDVDATSDREDVEAVHDENNLHAIEGVLADETGVIHQQNNVGEHLQSAMDDMSEDDFESAANATSLDSDDQERFATAARHRNPRAAHVEDGEDDSTRSTGRSAPASDALLRHIDSDDEDADPMVHPEATHTIYAPASTRPTQASSSEPSLNSPERIQRWLLSTGFTAIQARGDLELYVQRFLSLPSQQRTWILRMVEQRGGKDLAGRVKQAAELV